MVVGVIKAVFIDRDGTIGGVEDKVLYPNEMIIFPEVEESIKRLKEKGLLILSFTNQPGISRGEANRDDFEVELKSIGFDRIYLCPHEHNTGCNCRKPLPGMLLQAAKENDLDLRKCVVIGDRWTDLVSAQEAGSIKILVQTGAEKKDLKKYEDGQYFGKYKEAYPDYIAANIKDAAQWILNQCKESS
nr:HAD-IIIA family hydrolase [Paenibacillus camelliae]